mmetsp:Transcript_7156/g.9707  ORF Transcript_7156/g.9707 Transcript_7156/m.9707 type:complete len:93 (+) Transcript_7156:50-328(+)
MKPYDLFQLALGIIVGTIVLRPDLVQIPPVQPDVSFWPDDVPLEKAIGNNNYSAPAYQIPKSSNMRSVPVAFTVRPKTKSKNEKRPDAPSML